MLEANRKRMTMRNRPGHPFAKERRAGEWQRRNCKQDWGRAFSSRAPAGEAMRGTGNAARRRRGAVGTRTDWGC